MSRLLITFLAALALPVQAAEDFRQLAPLPIVAESSLRAEMRDNLRVLAEITELVVEGRLAEAADTAEQMLGESAMGKNRSLPLEARPGPHMPAAMHALGQDGHRDATAFATIARTGDREKTLAALPGLMSSCVACHHAYRIR